LSTLFVALAACSPQAPAQNASNTTEASAEPGAQFGLPQMAVTIHAAGGDRVINAQVAATPEQQERGLMFRRSLAPDEGMIFPYDPPASVSFWMHNTLIPLDMIFIRADGTIARITTAKALDDTPIPAGEPVAAVLEIGAGRAAELGIREGDRTDWRR
jgi:uncharacterized membrane protein (UPF0127 family)